MARTVSDWAVSGDAPDWITQQAKRADPNSVVHRQKRREGLRSIIKRDDGTEICDAAVAGDAPSFMVEANVRIDAAGSSASEEVNLAQQISQPSRYRHPSGESSRRN